MPVFVDGQSVPLSMELDQLRHDAFQTIQTSAGSLQNQINALQTTLQNDVRALQDSINALQQRLDVVDKRTAPKTSSSGSIVVPASPDYVDLNLDFDATRVQSWPSCTISKLGPRRWRFANNSRVVVSWMAFA